jgi:hypothetical protein
MTEKEIDKLINDELGDWAGYVMLALGRSLQKRKLILTGDLLRSLQYEVLKDAAEGTGKLRIMFQDAGRIRDMKAVTWKKLPPADAMEAYIKKIGLGKFKYVPGYKSGRFPISQKIAINRIAWGIAKGKQRHNKTVPKKWFAKPFYSMVYDLTENLTSAYQNAIAATLNDSSNG